MAALQLVKQLTCPACGDVVAQAAYRRFPPRLRLETPDGVLLQPSSGAVLLRIAQRQLADSTAADRADTERRVDFVRRHLGELMYELVCRRGHRTVQTMPRLVRAVRRTPGRWVPAG